MKIKMMIITIIIILLGSMLFFINHENNTIDKIKDSNITVMDNNTGLTKEFEDALKKENINIPNDINTDTINELETNYYNKTGFKFDNDKKIINNINSNNYEELLKGNYSNFKNNIDENYDGNLITDATSDIKISDDDYELMTSIASTSMKNGGNLSEDDLNNIMLFTQEIKNPLAFFSIITNVQSDIFHEFNYDENSYLPVHNETISNLINVELTDKEKAGIITKGNKISGYAEQPRKFTYTATTIQDDKKVNTDYEMIIYYNGNNFVVLSNSIIDEKNNKNINNNMKIKNYYNKKGGKYV